MSDIGHISLSDQVLRSRFKLNSSYARRPIKRPARRLIQDVVYSKSRYDNKANILRPKSSDSSNESKAVNSFMDPIQLQSAFNNVVVSSFNQSKTNSFRTVLQIGLISLAILMIGVGSYAIIGGLMAKNELSKQVSNLSAEANRTSSNNHSTVPSTVKPSALAISSYIVAPNLPRYLNIPKLGVHARVLSVGVTPSGALGTPDNVFDTAWYNESSLPGQPGAMLIDGHVSSWTAHGVFYGLKTLNPGDLLQVVRGDGTIFNYRVVKTVIFNSKNVNMTEALSSVNPGAPGLNLMSCTGDVIPGTSQFNERILVMSTLASN